MLTLSASTELHESSRSSQIGSPKGFQRTCPTAISLKDIFMRTAISIQCLYNQQEAVPKTQSQDPNSHFLTQDPVFLFFLKGAVQLAFGTSLVAVSKPLFFFFLFYRFRGVGDHSVFVKTGNSCFPRGVFQA